MRFSLAAFRLPALVCALALPLLTARLAAEDSKKTTSDYLHAPVLPDGQNIVIRLGPQNKDVQWRTANHREFTTLDKDDLLLTHGKFQIGYLRYNPLTVRLQVDFKEVDEPSQKILQSVISNLTSVAGILNGLKLEMGNPVAVSLTVTTGNKPPKPPTDYELVKRNVDDADQALDNFRKKTAQAADQIDSIWRDADATGPKAVAAGTDQLTSAQTYLTNATNYLAEANKHVKDATFNTGEQIHILERLDTLLPQVASLQIAFQKLTAVLVDAKNPSHWSGKDQQVFLFDKNIQPTFSTAENVTVTVIPRQLSIDPATNTLALKEDPPVNATFQARRYRSLLPEPGVGAVFGFIDRPSYGTTTDTTGKTVVALSKTDHVSVDPAVMVNFVCRCDAGGLAPMLQIGVATSKDLPAILLGGGIRLFGAGKGDFGLGGGLLLGWYKDLQTLKVGSTVTGTAQIDADLGYIGTPKPAPYLTLQYKF